MSFTRKTYGITGAISEGFNTIGAFFNAINNIASSAAEATEALPELGHDSGKLMAARAKANLVNQLKLQELNDK